MHMVFIQLYALHFEKKCVIWTVLNKFPDRLAAMDALVVVRVEWFPETKSMLAVTKPLVRFFVRSTLHCLPVLSATCERAGMILRQLIDHAGV
jgi:hypothetical protein